MLLAISDDLTASLDMHSVLKTAIESATRALELDSGAIYLLEGDYLVMGASVPGVADGQPDEMRRARLADHPYIERCVVERRPVVCPDMATADLSPSERLIRDAVHLKSLLYVPVIGDDAVIGAFIVGTVEPVIREFKELDITLCQALAHEIGLAMANARLYESLRRSHDELERAYDETLEGWSLALEMRDDETYGHALRVSSLSVGLARRMGVQESDLVHIKRGALLHDIGKMVVPDSILHKPGPLTDAEWEIMRKHPENGKAFLERIEYLAPVLDIPYCHHERWDGRGYPRGLKGPQIPLSARIFAVIDTFDALTSVRPYRDAWTEDDALAHIRSQAGGQFDPKVVIRFMEMMSTPDEARYA